MIHRGGLGGRKPWEYEANIYGMKDIYGDQTIGKLTFKKTLTKSSQVQVQAARRGGVSGDSSEKEGGLHHSPPAETNTTLPHGPVLLWWFNELTRMLEACDPMTSSSLVCMTLADAGASYIHVCADFTPGNNKVRGTGFR